MKLREAGLGDIIDLPTHYPSRVTVTSYGYADIACGFVLVHLGWSAPFGEGRTLLSENTVVRRFWECPPDAPIRQKAHADTEAALVALLASTTEG